jgi:hypothetical protein
MDSKDIKPHRGYIAAIFFLFIIMLFLAYSVWDKREQITDLGNREARLVEERDALRERLEEIMQQDTEADTPDTPRVERTTRSLLSDFEINRLRRQGLNDPVNDITRDLLRRSDLIQHEGVLGGTMGFYSPENIHILSPKWVFAYFEDGHIRGEMLLEYSVDNRGNISWKVIDSYLD